MASHEAWEREPHKATKADTDKPGAQRGPHGQGASATELMDQAQGRQATARPDEPHHWEPKVAGAEAPPMRILKAGTSETEWEFEGEDLEKKAWRYRRAAPLPKPTG